MARFDASTYAISARGFNHSTGTANKLQVSIDGRAVYSPLYSGVFWDEQDVPLADVDRIEVISGPGGTLWGTNAVNGVINIITRHSRDTQGALVDVTGGSLDDNVTLRYGGKVGEKTTYRIYAMGTERGALLTRSGSDANDAWQKLQGGFRADWASGEDDATLQGDIYRGVSDELAGSVQSGVIDGGNILGRWNRAFSDNSAFQVQLYYDSATRKTTSGVTSTVDTYDLDTQYSFSAGMWNAIVFGGGYRVTDDNFVRGPGTAFLDPAQRTLQKLNGFLQDEIALADALTLTLGVKIENNAYTGTEYMPDARIAWRLSDTDLLWAAVSRAVRTPARFDRDLINPGLLAGGPNFESEDLLAYEAGYRGQPSRATSFSLSLFYNVYDHLRTVEASTPVVFPLVVRNGMKGETYGVELWGNYALTPCWRLSAGVSTLHKDLRLVAGSRDIFGVLFAGNDPAYQASLRSQMDVADNVALDVELRAVDGLKSPRIPGYAEADTRLGWRVTESVELSLTGSNLLHNRHAEFQNAAVPLQEIPRSITASARWRF